MYFGKDGAGVNGTDLVRVESRIAQTPANPQTFVYDADGNLIDDGLWVYTWDAENRLVRMVTTYQAVAAGFPNRRLQFRYDYLGRRVQKLVFNHASGELVYGRRFLYDGWNLIGEYSDSGTSAIGTLVRSYTWGLDIARTLSDAGGVGALLQIADHASGKTYYPSYDGNGNIAVLVNSATGEVAAAFEYSPFGELLRSDAPDTTAGDQPFRFSTKYLDQETGLVYYGRRYYNPSHGRFIGRDPKGDAGGTHLYAFVTNNPTNKWDFLGMVEQMAAYGVNGGRRETKQEQDENGCLWEATYQDMSPDPAYGIEDMQVVQRVRISCPKNSDPSMEDKPDFGCADALKYVEVRIKRFDSFNGMLQSQLEMLAELGGKQSQLGAFFTAAVTDLAGVGVGMSAEHLMTGGSTSTVQTVGAAIHLAFNVAKGGYESGSGISEGDTAGGTVGLISSGTDAIYSGATLYGSIALANAAKRYTPYGQAYDVAKGLLSGGIAAWYAANNNGEIERLQASTMHSFNGMTHALADMEAGLELAREKCK